MDVLFLLLILKIRGGANANFCGILDGGIVSLP